MKEIKFRAWNKEEKSMGRVLVIDFSERTITFERLSDNKVWVDKIDNVYLVQYTGLKDKNGKEIYEGDVDERKAVIVCGNEFGEVVVRYRNSDKDIFSEIWNLKEKEIIGNIYENPELISK